MSYDVYLRAEECPACRHAPEDSYHSSPTYNIGGIFRAVLPGGIRGLDGIRAEESIPTLVDALARLKDPDRNAEFRAMEPDNGWGTLETAQEVIGEMIGAARENPRSRWRVT